MIVFLTGATGFIGRQVTARLVRQGHHVFGLSRTPEGVQAILELGGQGLVGDLRDPPHQLVPLLERIAPEAVLHLAAEVATQRNHRRIWEVDVEGTRRLLQACVGAGVPRLLLAGTVVVGDPHGATLTEDEPLVATTAYGRAKLEAERLVFEAADRHGFDATVLRPSHVYGPGGWFAGIVRDLRRGRFFVPGRGDNWWDLVHVDDVASAFEQALLNPDAARGEVFHVVDEEPLTMREFFDAIAGALGRGRPRSIPVWLARLVAGSGPIAAAVRSARSSNRKLKSRLGWRPQYPAARAVLAAVVAQID